jgi:hypothetical protein
MRGPAGPSVALLPLSGNSRSQTLDIPSLLCHDALYVPKQFSKDAGEVMLKHLEKEIPVNRIKLNRE